MAAVVDLARLLGEIFMTEDKPVGGAIYFPQGSEKIVGMNISAVRLTD
jgi:hypothetical protein